MSFGANVRFGANIFDCFAKIVSKLLRAVSYVAGQLRKIGLASLDTSDSAKTSSAIESALDAYTAKRLPPVETCMNSEKIQIQKTYSTENHLNIMKNHSSLVGQVVCREDHHGDLALSQALPCAK